ncbi:scavenger receptor cysteine-rich domain-containing protein DMBT1-like [Anableps anableps]
MLLVKVKKLKSFSQTEGGQPGGEMEKVLLILLAAAVDAQIRLVGPNRCSGRVEVFYNKTWGTVCDDGWDLSDAAVVCRQVGCGPPKSALMLAHFGQGSGQIWLDDVACVGTENSLPDCPHNGFGTHNCGHGEDAGVICEDAQFRLTGPTRCSGRVEVYNDEVWGTVCDDGWDMNEAAVLCRQLGCGLALRAPILAHFGQGTGEIWLDNMACSGSENSLSECSNPGFGIHNCGHGEDASVICAGAQIRLTGPTRCSGTVEVLFSDTWGTVCDDSWDLNDTAVVCRQLGCGLPQTALSGAPYGEGTGPIWLSNVSCSGTEDSLTECAHSGFGINSCGHAEDAAVICGEVLSSSSTSVRLLTGPSRCSGRVEVYYNQTWGTVCDDDWDMNDTEVVCRELGCDRAYDAPVGAHFGPGAGSILLDNLVCSGSESSLSECAHNGFGLQNCVHAEDAGALCESKTDDLSSDWNQVFIRKVVRLEVLPSSSLDLSDPAVLENLLMQLKQKLQDQGLNANFTLSWRSSDGKIFRKDEEQS